MTFERPVLWLILIAIFAPRLWHYFSQKPHRAPPKSFKHSKAIRVFLLDHISWCAPKSANVVKFKFSAKYLERPKILLAAEKYFLQHSQKYRKHSETNTMIIEASRLTFNRVLR